MDSRHLAIVVILGHHQQPEVDGGCGDERVGQFDGPLHAGGPAARDEASPCRHDQLVIGTGSTVGASARVPARRARKAASPALITPSSSSPMVTTDTVTGSGNS